VALTILTLGRRDPTPRPGTSAWQMVRPAELSERRIGLWSRSFGHARALALQTPPSLFPLIKAAVVRGVVIPAATTLRLLQRGRATAV